MKADPTLTAFCVLVAALLAGSALAFTCQAHGSEQRGTLAALESLPTYHEDRAPELADEKRAQLKAIATAVERYARSREHATLIVTVIYHESGLSLRITDGQCRKWECDGGRARGLGQNQRNGLTQEQWDRMHGLANIDAQIAETARRTAGMLGMCGDAEGAMRALTGRGCSARLPGIERRKVTFRQIERRM